MPYDPDIHHRRSIRLKDYDYSLRGLYFVTICTHDHIPRFGDVVEGAMILNSAGQMIERLYKECEHHFDNLRCLDYVVMPNHFHCIFQIVETASPKERQQVPLVGADLCVCPKTPASSLGGHAGPSLHKIIQWFKTMTTNEYIRGVKNGVFPPFHVRLWQRNYYEHVIRSQHSYDEIVEYIRNNPKQWYNDKLFHP
jgi:REP element-mobilizing transposase RayT